MIKRMKLLSFYFAFVILFFNILNAQTKTPYEMKMETLKREFLKDVGLRQVIIDELLKKKELDKDIMNLPEVRNAVQIFSSTEYGKLRVIKFIEDEKNAKTLKNEIDFQKDNQENAIKEKEKEKINFTKSDLYILKNVIAEKYNFWKVKGEFEKTEDFEARILNKETALSNILIESISELIKLKKVIVKLEKYDADKELYILNLSDDNSDRFDGGEIKTKWQGSIKISPEKAQKLNDKFFNNSFICTFDYCKLTILNNNIVPENVKLVYESISYPIVSLTPVDLGANFFNEIAKELIPNTSTSYSLNNYNLNCQNQNSMKEENEIAKLEEEKRKIEAEKIRKAEEQKKLELIAFEQKEEKFKSLVEKAENGNVNFNNKKPNDIKSVDFSEYKQYLRLKISYYEQALEIKGDEEVKQKLEETKSELNEFNEILEKKEKQKNTVKNIKKILK